MREPETQNQAALTGSLAYAAGFHWFRNCWSLILGSPIACAADCWRKGLGAVPAPRLLGTREITAFCGCGTQKVRSNPGYPIPLCDGH